MNGLYMSYTLTLTQPLMVSKKTKPEQPAMLWAILLGRLYRMGLNLHVNRLDDFDAYDEIKLLQVKNFRFKNEEVKYSTNQIQLIEFWQILTHKHYTVKIVVFDQFVFTYLLMIEKASRNTSTISNFW